MDDNSINIAKDYGFALGMLSKSAGLNKQAFFGLAAGAGKAGLFGLASLAGRTPPMLLAIALGASAMAGTGAGALAYGASRDASEDDLAIETKKRQTDYYNTLSSDLQRAVNSKQKYDAQQNKVLRGYY